MGGHRHSSDATAVGNRKQNACKGGPFFARFKGVLKLKKGTPRELRGRWTQRLGVQEQVIG